MTGHQTGVIALQLEENYGLAPKVDGMEPKQLMLWDKAMLCLGVSQEKGSHTRWGTALCNTGSPKALLGRRREGSRKGCRAVSSVSFKCGTNVTGCPCSLVTVCLLLHNQRAEREGGRERKEGRDKRGGEGEEGSGERGQERQLSGASCSLEPLARAANLAGVCGRAKEQREP